MATDQNVDFGNDMNAGGPVSECSTWGIIAGVFTKPTESFAAFNLKPRILIILLVAIILGLVSNYFMAEYSAKMQYEMVSQSTVIPPQQLEQMREKIDNPDRVMGAIFGAVGQVVVGVIIALLAWALGSFVMGGESTFKKVWGVTMLGGLIPLAGAVIKLPLIIAKDSMYVSFGLAALFPEKDFTSIVYSVLFFFDAFMIWSLIVTGIGFAAIFNITRGKGIAIALILDLLFIGFMIGIMAVGMSFAGVELSFF
jgi:hypothetical protein